jgi:dsRNA-specific ribonuclease
MRTRSERLIAWLQNHPCQHYGHKARIPELFQRRDLPLYALYNGKLRLKASPPTFHHDLLDAAARVGALEPRLGYTFKNRMTCIEALKVTGELHSLYFDGTIHEVGRNNRLALLGDRVLSLAVCEIWFHTEHSNKEHSAMSQETVSRAALAITGRALGLHQRVLLTTGGVATRDHIAETLEALLGAIYVDSGYDMNVVKAVIHKLKIDDHRFLKTREETEEVETKPVLSQIVDQRAMVSIAPEQPPKQSIKQTATTPAPNEPGPVKPAEKDAVEETKKKVTNSEYLSNVKLSTGAKREIEAIEKIMGNSRNAGRAGDAMKALHRYAQLMKEKKPVSVVQIFREFRRATGRAHDLALQQERKERERKHVEVQKAEAELKKAEPKKDTQMSHAKELREARERLETFDVRKRARIAVLQVEARQIQAVKVRAVGSTPQHKLHSTNASQSQPDTTEQSVRQLKQGILDSHANTWASPVTEARLESYHFTEAAGHDVQADRSPTETVNETVEENFPESEVDLLFGGFKQDNSHVVKAPATDYACDKESATSDSNTEFEAITPPRIGIAMIHTQTTISARGLAKQTQVVTEITDAVKLRTRMAVPSNSLARAPSSAEDGGHIPLLPECMLRTRHRHLVSKNIYNAYAKTVAEAMYQGLRFGSTAWITFLRDTLDRKDSELTRLPRLRKAGRENGIKPLGRAKSTLEVTTNEESESMPISQDHGEAVVAQSDEVPNISSEAVSTVSNKPEHATDITTSADQPLQAFQICKTSTSPHKTLITDVPQDAIGQKVQRGQLTSTSPISTRGQEAIDEESFSLYPATLPPSEREDGGRVILSTGPKLAEISQLRNTGDEGVATAGTGPVPATRDPVPLSTSTTSDPAASVLVSEQQINGKVSQENAEKHRSPLSFKDIIAPTGVVPTLAQVAEMAHVPRQESRA